MFKRQSLKRDEERKLRERLTVVDHSIVCTRTKNKRVSFAQPFITNGSFMQSAFKPVAPDTSYVCFYIYLSFLFMSIRIYYHFVLFFNYRFVISLHR